MVEKLLGEAKSHNMARIAAFAFTLLLAGSISVWAPTQGTVVAFKICLVTIAALLGYWIDRMLFPHTRVHILKDAFDQSIIRGDKPECHQVHANNFNMAQLRRAIIVLAVVLGVCLGL